MRPCSSTAVSAKTLAVLAALLAGAISLTGCLPPKRPPVLEDLVRRADREPVILLPGITGTRLREPGGRVVWGDGRSVFLPRDGGASVAVPVPGAPAEGRALVTDGPVARVNVFGLLRFEVYSAVIRLMEANGYRHGDLDEPRPDDTFFVFAYDWRHGNTVAAARLGEALERLRRARGEDVLEVSLICQSNAARIARYFLKYGGATLERAEAGRASPPEDVRVRKLILVGTANGGAIGTLTDMQRGRRYVPILGRRFRPEMIFTFESIYEGLPLLREDLFIDREGNVLRVDLGDPRSWKRYEWSVYRPAVRRRLERGGAGEVYGTESQRDAFLAGALDRARRLQRLLGQDVEDFGATRYYMIQNGQRPTEKRALLEQRNGRWRTRFFDDGAVRDDPWLRALATEPGDGHATLTSQMDLSPRERAALARPPVWVDVPHRTLVLDQATHRAILEFLREP